MAELQILPPRKDVLYQDYVPVDGILPDGKTCYGFAGKQLFFSQVIRLAGMDYQSVPQDTIENLARVRKELFGSMPDVLISSYVIRREVAFEKIAAAHGSQIVDQMVAKHYASFGTKYQTQQFLVVSLDGRGLIKKPMPLLPVAYDMEDTKFLKRVQELSGYADLICKQLEDYTPEVLKNTENNKDILDFWYQLINGGGGGPLPRHSKHLAYLLSASTVHVPKGADYIEFHGDRLRYAAVVSIKDLPDQTTVEVFSRLFQSRIHFHLVQHIQGLSPERMNQDMKNQLNKLQLLSVGYLRRIADEVHAAQESNLAGDEKFTRQELMLIVFADSQKELDKKVSEARGFFLKEGITTVRETFQRILCFMGQFPGYHDFLQARRNLVSTVTAADLISFEAPQQGVPYSAFGPEPVSYFSTLSDNLYSFNFHPRTDRSCPGHCLIIGPTGSGKTMLTQFLLASCLKYKHEKTGNRIKILGFDRYRGMKIATHAFGGDYNEISRGCIPEINPFFLEDTSTNRTFLQDWIGNYLAGGLRTGHEEEEREAIKQALDSNFSITRDERSLDALTLCFGREGTGGLRDRLKRWLPPSTTRFTETATIESLIFNGTRDALTFEKSLVVFDMTELLRIPDIAAALTYYIFHALENHINENPAPFIAFCDEMAAYLSFDPFAEQIKIALREWRKRQGAFIGAIQDPVALTASKHGKDIISNIATMVIFPNTRAGYQEFVEGLGLSEEEYEWVRTPNALRQVMVKDTSGRSVILNVDLGHLGPFLRVLSSDKDTVEEAGRLQQEFPDHWLEIFIQGGARAA